MPVFTSDALLRLTTSIFTRAGASPDDAHTVAEHLVEANLTGHLPPDRPLFLTSWRNLGHAVLASGLVPFSAYRYPSCPTK